MIALPLFTLAGAAMAAPPAAFSGPFSVSLSASPTAGAAPLSVTFTATVSAGTPESVSWNFGDGALWNGSAPGALTVTHRYSSIGSFSAVATVVESTGSAAATTSVAVGNAPVVATISATPTGGSAPLSVVFRAVVSGGSGTYPTFAWTFGDGHSGSGAVITHTFTTTGSFTVALTVTDSAGASTSVSTLFTVPAPSATSPSWGGSTMTTIATAGIAGAGITFGVYAVGRRRRGRYDPDDDPEAYGQIPPGAIGPRGDALGLGLSAGAPASEETAASAISSDEASSPSSSPRASVVFPSVTPNLLPSVSPPVPPPSTPAAPQRRWSSELVAYLGGLPTLGPDDIPTLDWTQKGMSDRLGTGQNQVSNVLRRLVSAGLVIEELQHVQGQPRRLKVYRLTMRGEGLARELRRNRAGGRRDYLKSEW